MGFPASLDSFPSAATLATHDLSTDPHSKLHGDLGVAVSALEAKVGVDSSADTSSLDYKVANRQPLSGNLTTLAGLSLAAYGYNFLAVASASAGRTYLGLGSLATKNTAAESDLSLSDVTTGNVSTAAHGFAPKAPNDTTKYLRGDGTWATVAAGGGVAVSSGTFATRPASGTTAGDLYLPTDGVCAYRWGVAAWSPFGPVLSFTDPTLQAFSWVNQDGATVDATKGGIRLAKTATTTDYQSCRVKSAPSTPYSIVAAFTFGLTPASGSGSSSRGSVGLVWRESGSGKLVLSRLFLDYGGSNFPKWEITKQTNATTWNSNYQSIGAFGFCSPVWWMKISDDGTFRTVYASHDGQSWQQVHQVSRADFCTPDQVGFHIGSWTAGGIQASLLSWQEASP